MPATAARTRWLVAPIVALSVVGLAACSGTDSTTGTSASTSAAATTSAAGPGDAKGEPAGMMAFNQCMTAHGVTGPARPDGAGGRPGGGEGGPPAPASPRPRRRHLALNRRR